MAAGRTLGFDAPFRRLWEYYLCYCEAGFRSGMIDVGLYSIFSIVVPELTAARLSICADVFDD